MADTEYTREREAFELWYVGHTFDTTPPEIERNAQGDYILMGTRLAWQAWHAGWLALAALPSASIGEQRLERALADMEARKDGAYEERNKVVAALAKLFPSGIARTAIEGWSEDWHGCVYIDLPTGQVSWHFHDSQAYLFDGLPPYTGVWDGHDTPEKYRRLAALPSASPPPQEPSERLHTLLDRLDGYLNSPEQIQLRDELLAALPQEPREAEQREHTDHPMRHWDRTCPACNPVAASPASKSAGGVEPTGTGGIKGIAK